MEFVFLMRKLKLIHMLREADSNVANVTVFKANISFVEWVLDLLHILNPDLWGAYTLAWNLGNISRFVIIEGHGRKSPAYKRCLKEENICINWLYILYRQTRGPLVT